MAKLIYYVTYDMELYSKPDVWDKEYKKYNKSTGFFEEIDEKPAKIDANSIIADNNVTHAIMKEVFHSKYGQLLTDDKMKWYLNYEKESKKHPKLLKNNELLYNYLVLKATLAGMPEEFAEKIYANYMFNLEEYSDRMIPPNQILEKFDKIIQEKIYWIPNIENELNKECLIIDDIIRKRSTSPDYNFSQFEARYLKLCSNGYLKKIKEYNENPNNLYSRGLSFEEQKDFLINYFSKSTKFLIETLADNYSYFKGNFDSKKALHDNMVRTMEYSMKYWEE